MLTHRQLLQPASGPDYVDATQNLRVFMAGLRKKLEADPSRPRYLVTEPGVGYRLRADEMSESILIVFFSSERSSLTGPYGPGGYSNPERRCLSQWQRRLLQ